MAVPKQATVISSEALSESTRHVVVQADAPLGFVGGQYVIVDSGLTLPSGKAAKRAYSMLSADDEQGRLEFAVMRIENETVLALVETSTVLGENVSSLATGATVSRALVVTVTVAGVPSGLVRVWKVLLPTVSVSMAVKSQSPG